MDLTEKTLEIVQTKTFAERVHGSKELQTPS